MVINALQLQIKQSEIDEIIEKKRHKGGKLWNKDPETTTFVKLFYIPAVKFEVQYLKKTGLMRKKTPHRVQNLVRVFAFGEHKDFEHVSDEKWLDRLYPEYGDSEVISVTSGSHIAFTESAAKDVIEDLFKKIKDEHAELQYLKNQLENAEHLKKSTYKADNRKYSEMEKEVSKQNDITNKYSKKLNISGDLDSIQKNLGYELMYIPWYVVKLDKPSSHRYLVIDHLGKIDQYISERITHWDYIYDLLERYKKEI